MADKFPSGVSVDIGFVNGEIPTANKLSAITAQTRRAVSNIESAVGDLRGESFPYSSASTTTLSGAWGRSFVSGADLSGALERKLDIVSLGRLIGPASNLNPKMLPNANSITEEVPVGVYEFSLRYPTSDTSTVSTTDPSMTDKKNVVYNLQDAGDWHVGPRGKVRTVTATTGGSITYTTDPNLYNGGLNYPFAHFNVIPDPNQIAQGTGVNIGAVDGQGRYPIVLPQVLFQQSDIDGLDIELTSADVNHQRTPSLPKVLTDNFTTGEIIPAGFLYLKNETTGEVYDNGVYYYNTTNALLVGNVELATPIALGHVFSIITVGTDITTSIDDLRNKMFHSHDRANGEPFIHVTNIIGQHEISGVTGIYPPSNIPSNYFPQYLHRDGYQPTLDQNLNESNVMRGPLLIGVNAGTPGSFVSTSGSTFGVRFGDNETDGPYIRRNNSNQFLFSHLRGDIRLQAGGDILLDVNSANPGSPTSDSVRIVNGPLLATEGIRSKQDAANIAVWATQGNFTTQISYGTAIDMAVQAEFDNIRNEEWISVQLYLVDGDERFPAGEMVADREWRYFWTYTAGVNHLWVSIDGTSWSTNTLTDFQVVIWYLP